MGRAAVASLHIVEEDTPVTLSSAKCKRRDDGGSREQRP
ncbi:hypothetical protein JMJ77_0011278 [Colletotrichum scovillei]|uniref:Uncharacterized protein n=1 Tax=Colletotrichum scovillei TaxID=1209932 RepID=A0A9P7R1V8_9PEZI|nr:hypothetical protein JMJ77_0011278 [Colletotrichum scovillei]KAG7060255.1 hypothetical protein JMJ78_0015530 [Colletotrichum scovillei]KAG7067707.1 hypothetical protein JMJ76_0009135 [Colletotrichum scovillei]